jgi:fermentation-respiration switch protein FrsA (DUF1100 family)
MPGVRRLAMATTAAFLLGYLVAAFCLWKWQARLIFAPRTEIDATPESYGASFEEVWVPIPGSSGEAEKLNGWWMGAAQRNPKALLYLHGNGDNISANAAHAVRLHSLGLSVLLFDYRGYGRSGGGFPSEATVYADAETAWQYLVEQRRLSPNHIFIYGHSLGGAVAIELARRHPEAAGLIVESSFTSMADMARRLGVFRIFPLGVLLHQRFENISKVRSLRIPVLFLHGTSDRTVPFQMSQQLFSAAPEPKQLLLIPGGHHADCATVSRILYLTTMQAFVSPVPAPAQPTGALSEPPPGAPGEGTALGAGFRTPMALRKPNDACPGPIP